MQATTIPGSKKKKKKPENCNIFQGHNQTCQWKDKSPPLVNFWCDNLPYVIEPCWHCVHGCHDNWLHAIMIHPSLGNICNTCQELWTFSRHPMGQATKVWLSCYLVAKPGNKTTTPLRPDPYSGVIWTRQFCSYPSEFLHWNCSNHTMITVPVK